MAHTRSLTYQDAGVDIQRGNRLVDHLKDLAAGATRAGVVDGIGGFGALFEIPAGTYDTPVLVSGADGVGTKLKLAIETGIHDTIGIDLVAMCANDILVHGAEPLFFLDYFATGRLDLPVAREVMSGVAKGCKLAGAALIGGETAEMPGLYAGKDYDLAGFCVGVVEKAKIIDGRTLAAGDIVIGLAASGPHANGYALIRKILEETRTSLHENLDGRTLRDTLLTPTRIYVRPLRDLVREVPIRAMAHVTGGGILENLPRVLPTGTRARIDTRAWRQPAIFSWLRTAGGIAEQEMYRTFNCGIGMIVCVPPEAVSPTMGLLEKAHQPAWIIGKIEATHGQSPQVILE